MTKADYMKTLAYSLRHLPKEEFEQAMDYFEEYFAEAGPENEQQAIEDLGSPDEAAKTLIINLAAKNVEEPPKTVKHSFKAVWIGLIALCAAPIALPLAFCLICVIAALIFAILCVLGGILLSAFCVLAAAVIGFIGGIALLFSSFANGIATLGFSLLCAGGGVLFLFVAFQFCKWFLQKIVQFLGKLMKKKGAKHETNH